ncbi:zinc-dependent dehydrogenase [soil metagenome]
MRAAVFHGPGRLEVADRDVPRVGPDEVLVKMGATTLCGTDVRILRGEKTSGVDPPTVLGHEIAGRVERAGRRVSGYDAGVPVGIVPVVACGRCFYCRRGMENTCARQVRFGYQIEGGLSEYVRVPAAAVAAGNLVVAGRELPPEQLALAEPLSCCVNGHQRSRIGVGDTVLVLGAGPIGLLHVQLALLAGAGTVVVSEPAEPRRGFAGRLGAHVLIDPDDADVGEAVADVTDGRGADSTIVCIGVPALVDDALRVTRAGGVVNVFAGLAGEGWAHVQANLIHYKELVVTGTTGSGRAHYATAVGLIERGQVDVGSLVTHRFPLASAAEALDATAGGEGIKVAVLP